MGASPYYTNSTQLPVNYSDDIFEILKHQDKLQTLYTGGTVLHIFTGENNIPADSVKNLIRKITAGFHLPYMTLSPTFSICPSHGYVAGEHFICPDCGKDCEVYSRIVGYLRPVSQWNSGKRHEYKDRVLFRITDAPEIRDSKTGIKEEIAVAGLSNLVQEPETGR